MTNDGPPTRGSTKHEAFFAACSAGDVRALTDLLARDPALVQARGRGGATCLHLAVAHPAAVRLLLQHDADPNVREAGDDALPLHFAAGGGHVESVRALLDAGSDVHGSGDMHELDVIGWATVPAEPRREVVDVLVERGARHHVFSAIALGDVELLRRIVHSDPDALGRRLSRFEQHQTAVHYVVAPADGLVGGTFRTGDHYRTLEALVELGADLDARDARDRTPLEIAMLRGDREAMRILHAAGASLPPPAEPEASGALAGIATATGPMAPMLTVPDIAATVAWYRSIGFELAGTHGDNGMMDWASVRFGDAEIMFAPAADPWRTANLTLWIRSDRIDELYSHLKRRQMARARAALLGQPDGGTDVPFRADLYTAFYGQREFTVRDPNGVDLSFYQPVE